MGTKGFKPLMNEVYYTEASISGMGTSTWVNSDMDKTLYAQGAIFKTAEEALQSLRFRRVKEKIREVADRLGTPTESDLLNKYSSNCYYIACGRTGDMTDEITYKNKWRIYQAHNISCILTDIVYCTKHNFLEEVLKEVTKEDLFEYLTNGIITGKDLEIGV